jgi:hypothetical protein
VSRLVLAHESRHSTPWLIFDVGQMKISICAMFSFLFGLATASGAEPKKDEVVRLPPFEVRESGVTDFGMSVVTNFAVASGGTITWMRVGNLVPGSAAALAGLNTNDEIISVDGVMVSNLSKSAMLHTFFHRKIGARVKLLVVHHRTRLLRQVELRCNANGIEKKPNKAPEPTPGLVFDVRQRPHHATQPV